MTTPQTTPADHEHLYALVVIGASAGGIEALSVLLTTLPAPLPVPIVIAQHLDPRVPSHLGQILARRSTMPVNVVTEGATEHLEPATIYVIPANHDVEVTDGSLRLQRGKGLHPMPSIDRLFTSAAKAYGERVIAVVLTGSGSDGAVGAREVKLAGGAVLIENPQTASYPSMPGSLPPTVVDLALDLEQLGPALANLVGGLQVVATPTELDGTQQEPLPGLLSQVRQHTGVDFSGYKPATILRRLHRRLVATGATTVPDYQRVLDDSPDEYAHLLSSFLINVTEFFRDPTLFTFLRDRILPEMIARARARSDPLEIRVWSAGCSTGEEAYSVAMLLHDALGQDLLRFSVRIFATDVDADAVAFARRGRYPASTLANVPESFRERYFVASDDGFEIAKALRGMVIFGEHDLAQQAPFPHVDMVLCRNVLIYFMPELQLRTLQLFAFSLRDGGYLVLGTAESASALAANFAVVAPHFKVFRRQGGRVLVPPLPVGGKRQRRTPASEGALSPPQLSLVPPLQTPTPAPQVENGTPSQDLAQRNYNPSPRERFAEQILGLPVGIVVIDRNYDVLTVNSAAYALLDIYRPIIGRDLLHMAERIPTQPLRAAIDQAFEGALPVPVFAAAQVQVTAQRVDEEEPRQLRITAYPYVRATAAIADRPTPQAEAVILFITDISREQGALEIEGAVADTPAAAQAADQVVRRQAADLAADLAAERAQLHDLKTAIAELRQENEGLRRSNESLAVSQEEVQASAEETKTFNEEMQATNEELETLNEELEATVEELHTTNDDLIARNQELQEIAESREVERRDSEGQRARLSSILSGLGDAVFAADAKGATLIANEAFERLFGDAEHTVLEDDQGQPLPPSAAPWRRVLDGDPFRMGFTLRGADGTRRWFEASGRSVLVDGRRVGGVVSIRDLSNRTLRSVYEHFLAQATSELAFPSEILSARLQAFSGQLPPGDDQLRSQFDVVLHADQQLTLLLGDLADLQRAPTETPQLAVGPVDMVELAQRVVNDLTLVAHVGKIPTPIVVRSETDRGPLVVLGDAVRLEQMLRALLANALRYGAESDRVDARIRRVREHAEAEMVEVEVQDYGPGIPAGDLPYVFAPFYQAPQGGVSFRSGLGIGLYLAQQVVLAHGGQIEVRSPEGRGVVSTVRLPVWDEGQPTAEPGDKPTRKKPSPNQSHPH